MLSVSPSLALDPLRARVGSSSTDYVSPSIVNAGWATLFGLSLIKYLNHYNWIAFELLIELYSREYT